MTYTYTYRDKSGAVHSETVDADSRAVLLSKLKVRGIVPLTVKEGGRVSPVKSAVSISPRTVLVGCIAVVALVAALAYVTWVNVGPSSTNDEKTKKTALLPVNKALDKRKSKQTVETAGPSKDEKKVVATTKVKATPTNAVTGNVEFPQLPNVGTNLPPQAVPLPPPTFETASDQVIAMALQVDEHGAAPIPLSKDLEKEFLESLKTEIVILDSDDAQTKALKEQVMATRAEIKRMMDEGQSFNQIMQEHQKLANENAKIRDEATLDLKKLLDAGDVEGAKAYKQKINRVLEQMGIKGLSIAVTDEEREERAASRRERMLERRARQAAAAEAAKALKNAQEGK